MTQTMDASAMAVQGLQQADAMLEAAASAIVRAGAASSSVGNSDVVDLSAEMVALMSARTLFDAKPRDAKNRERSAKHPDRGNHLRPNLQHQTQRAHHHTWQAFSATIG